MTTINDEQKSDERIFLHAIANPIGALSFLLEIQMDLVGTLGATSEQVADLIDISSQLNQALEKLKTLLDERRTEVKRAKVNE